MEKITLDENQLNSARKLLDLYLDTVMRALIVEAIQSNEKDADALTDKINHTILQEVSDRGKVVFKNIMDKVKNIQKV